MIRRPPRSTQSRSSAASDVYKRQLEIHCHGEMSLLGEDEGGPHKVDKEQDPCGYRHGNQDARPVIAVELRLLGDHLQKEVEDGRGGTYPRVVDQHAEHVVPVSYTHLRAHETRHDL